MDKDTPIEDLGLSLLSWNCLQRHGIKTAGEIPKDEEGLSRVRNLMKKNVEEILEKLKELGLNT